MQLRDNFSNYEISAIQSLCFMGAYFTFFSGIILDRMGPVVAITLGAFFVVFGYFGIAISALFSSFYLFFIKIFKYFIKFHSKN